ncbi:MAG: DMT family transporter [Gammaproteobacteria bacterium]
MQAPQDNLPRAAAMMLATALLFALMGALVKSVSTQLPGTMVVFFRNVLGLVALLPWLLRGGIAGLRTRNLRLHMWRSLSGITAMYCFFHALAHLPLAHAVLLNYTAPLFIPLIATLWLHEPFPGSVRAAVLIGFLGIALILKPGTMHLDLDALIGLGAGVFTAFAFTSMRRMGKIEPTTRIVFYFGVFATLISAVPLAWTWITPPRALWGRLLLIGVLATSAQLLVTRAHAYAPAARLGPFMYSIVVFAAMLGWLFWNETIDAWSLVGAVLVSGAGILASRAQSPAAS